MCGRPHRDAPAQERARGRRRDSVIPRMDGPCSERSDYANLRVRREVRSWLRPVWNEEDAIKRSRPPISLAISISRRDKHRLIISRAATLEMRQVDLSGQACARW